MSVEIVFNETLENVEAALHAAFADCGFRVRPSPMADGVEVKAKMSFWLGEKGNGLLSLALPFLFKTDSVAAVLAAYQDGTTALTLRENSAFGGNLAGGATHFAGRALDRFGPGGVIAGAATAAGTTVGGAVAAKADGERKSAALAKQLAAIEARLRERLSGKIAYEGPVKPNAQQVLR